MKSKTKVVVVGGGVVGVSALYHLAKKGWSDVVLVERKELTSGSTWHAAGLLPLFNMSYSVGQLHKYAVDLYKKLEEETGKNVGFSVVSNIRLASTKDRMDEYHQYAGVAKTIGVDVKFLTPQQVKEIWPLCHTDDLVGAIQHPEDGTVDIEYTVEEKPSDQIELSGGWGGGRVVGTLGISFTNFAASKMFKKGTWRPIPTGDGQRVSLRAQSNGLFFQSYNFSFTEPWLGGRKPNSLSFSVWRSIQSNGQPKRIDGEVNEGRQSLEITGAQLGLGQRWKKPDDWFVFQTSLSYQHFNLNEFGSFFSFTNGRANNLALTAVIGRNSVSDPIFPTWGSNVEVSVKATPPYSVFRPDNFYENLDGSSVDDQTRYRWVEYHKWKVKAEWYTPLTQSRGENPKSLVLRTSAGVGMIGQYNRRAGLSPFERFYLGGVFLSGFVLDGREILNLRGYDDLSLTAPDRNTGAPVVAKYGAELRYPLSTNPSATIYTLAFLEGGNTWEDPRAFNPFQVYRSAGVGLRIFLPMFGLLGLDYGWRLDDLESIPNMDRSQFHFSIGMNMGEL